jgi:cytochrome c-type biogenesis protein CcmH
MMIFWLVCATLVAIGLAFVLPPLLQRSEQEPDADDRSTKDANVEVYRDQLAELKADLSNGLISDEQYQQDKQEYERRLLDDVAAKDVPQVRKPDNRGKLAYSLALALPLVAVIFYLRVGHPSALSASPAPAGRASVAAPSTEPNDEAGFSPQRIEANVATLAKKLEQNPNDVAGWIMLGRSYTSLGKYADASAAYKKATALKSNDADLLADYAFALAMANGKKLSGEPTEIINKALKIDPENPKALELAGSAAFEANDFSTAIKHWEKLLTKTANDPEIGKALNERIEDAKSKLKR